MSNALAIAAVTETLVNLVTAHIDAANVTGAQVTALAPDDSSLPNPGVNIFLYQVTPNKAYRNADLPTRDANGNLLRKPMAALDLHYLFTFYGNESAREQQRLLGAVTLALHANPLLPRSMIQAVQAATPFLITSTLDVQHELIRFTPVVFSLEELSKLWSFLLKIDYVLSTAYLASVVLIETDDAVPPPALPVLSYTATAAASGQPVISRIVASPDPTKPILAGGNIDLLGSNLAAPSGGSTQVLINGAVQTATTITPTRITLALPSSLQAGAQTAQIMQPLSLGVPPVLHSGTGVASSIAAFVLLPAITPGSVSVKPGPALALTVTPQVQAGQRVVLQLTSQATPATTRLFDGGTLTAPSAALSIPIPGLGAGNYFVQVLVDGASSPPAPAAPAVTV
jgi:hypothetical protein